MGMLTDVLGAGKSGAFGKRVQKRLGGGGDPSDTVQQDAPSPAYAPGAQEAQQEADEFYGRRKRSNGKNRGY